MTAATHRPAPCHPERSPSSRTKSKARPERAHPRRASRMGIWCCFSRPPPITWDGCPMSRLWDMGYREPNSPLYLRIREGAGASRLLNQRLQSNRASAPVGAPPPARFGRNCVICLQRFAIRCEFRVPHSKAVSVNLRKTSSEAMTSA